MQIINCKQGSDEWKRVRAGRMTGSRMIDVMALSKPKTALCIVEPSTGEIVKKLGNGVRADKMAEKLRGDGINVKDVEVSPAQPLQARIDYGNELAFERIAGVPQLSRDTVEMRWGRNCEDYARFAYEARTGIRVQTVGFCMLESGYVGISPDGLVRDDGGVEIKSPYNGRVHVDTWLHGMPEDHKHQVQACMWVTGRQWWDFVSFDPRVKKHVQLYIETIYRDDDYIAKLAAECERLNVNVDEIVKQVLAKNKAYSAKANDFEAVAGDVPQMPIPDMNDRGDHRGH